MAKDKKAVDKGPTIGSVARENLKAGKTNEQVLEAVKKQFPDGGTSLQSVSWYRNDMRSKGDKVSTAKEAKAKQAKAAGKNAA